MVQIKLYLCLATSADVALYIPHGSDKTYSMACTDKGAGVLYIPHGSDKTSLSISLSLKAGNFISHMVQIKLITFEINTKPVPPLYPTWFR